MNENLFTANVMADIYETYSMDGTLAQKGYDMLVDLFGDVSEAERAEVYVAFVGILNKKGVDYDPEYAKLGVEH